MRQHCFAVLSDYSSLTLFLFGQTLYYDCVFYTSIMDMDYHPIMKVWEGDSVIPEYVWSYPNTLRT